MPEQVSELTVARHGQSTANVAFTAAQTAGLLDCGVTGPDAAVELSPLGWTQAEALGLWLAALPPVRQPEVVVCSPYVRARQTWQCATDTAGDLGVQLPKANVDARLRDRLMGELELLTTSMIAERSAVMRRRTRTGGSQLIDASKACIYTLMSDLSSRELELCTKVSTLCACNQLRRTAREITQLYDDALAQSGLAVTQLPILVALGSRGALPMTILADKLSLDRTTLTRNLRILEVRGLVRIVAHEEDARVHLASLTSAGARVLGEALELWEQVQSRIEQEFDPTRLRSLSLELVALREAAGT